jgi:hypothetical protein
LNRLTKLLALIILVMVLLGGAAAGWYQFWGPGMQAREARAESAIKASEQLVAGVQAARAAAGRLPAAWAGLKFDEAAETGRIQADLAAERGYKVDVRRDPAAAAIAAGLTALDATLTRLSSDLKQNAADLAAARQGMLRAGTDDRIAKAEGAARQAAKLAAELTKNIAEVKHDNDVWGFYALCLQADADLLLQLDGSDAALTGGDFQTARTMALNTLELVNVSATWLTRGNQELTNIGVYSHDAENLLAFVSKAKDAANAFEAAGAAGLRGSTDSLTPMTEQAEKQLAALRQLAAASAIGHGYQAWFIANARRHLTI